ncbi:DUF775-domain-containing protein [Exidia glandulosa HHB12029]|uniref:DUF775-domain-containing protein n=1 Tax=Exidia glandulosa HHB12029 TaxID=1314781 RepID=A0A165N8D7_EXIGL|nr:DUF775-domain-containing protein [Exidia glandulosa HHB12029]
MFGCVIPGRWIDETHAVFHLRDAASINHICVFLLGTVPFPPDYGATLFIYLPGKGFQLLGMYVSFGDSVLIALSNDKPSAIFRLRGTYTASSSAANTLSDAMISTSEDASCMLGISVEPLASVYAQVPPTAPTMPAPTTQDPAVLAEKVVKHLFNFLSSFSANPAAPLSPDTSVPIGLVSKWYESFMSKLRTTGTAFLDRASD